MRICGGGRNEIWKDRNKIQFTIHKRSEPPIYRQRFHKMNWKRSVNE
jgi:hypothetical protein